jgi:hypothetical protein
MPEYFDMELILFQFEKKNYIPVILLSPRLTFRYDVYTIQHCVVLLCYYAVIHPGS